MRRSQQSGLRTAHLALMGEKSAEMRFLVLRAIAFSLHVGLYLARFEQQDAFLAAFAVFCSRVLPL